MEYLATPGVNLMLSDFLIDTDTASDDAVALIMALRVPDVIVRGITVVAGNVGLNQATRNAILVTELCGVDVPVFAGADRPLMRPAEDATWFHGRDGLGDMNYPPPRRKPETTHAVEAIIELTRVYPGLVLVTLGPLTNIATALVREPAIAKNISRCVVMGGNPCCVGNVTPAAEYNIWCDPEAAQIVMRSGLPIELVGWHLCRGEANLNAADIAHVRSIDTPLAHFAIDSNRVAAAANQTQTGEIGIALPDPTAMAIAIDPSLVTHASRHLVAVECQSELTRGMTVVDQLNVGADVRNQNTWADLGARQGGAKVVWSMHVAGFKRLLFKSLA